MPSNKYIQFIHENDTWLRTLDYFRQENIYLKNRLAQIAKAALNPTLLSELETYQNRFVDKDTVLSILRFDIIRQNDLINSYNAMESGPEILFKIQSNQAALREDMQHVERAFNSLKFDFNNYLAAIL